MLLATSSVSVGCWRSHTRRPDARDGSVDGRGSDAPPTCPGAASAPELEAYLREMAAAECAGEVHCASGPGWSLEVCIESRLGWHTWAAARAMAVGGLLGIDRRNADACLAGLRAACPRQSPDDAPFRVVWRPPECAEVLHRACGTPMVCTAHVECPPGARCTSVAVGDDLLVLTCGELGECVPATPFPETCSDDADCCSHERCAAMGLCVGGRCRTLRAPRYDRSLGESCNLLEPVEGDGVRVHRCGDGLRCRPDSATCAQLITVGEPCGGLEYCERGLRCGDVGRCEVWAGDAPGDACTPVATCEGPQLVCASDGRCAVGDGGTGSPCHVERVPCNPGHACLESGRPLYWGVCGPASESGDGCWRNSECRSGQCVLGGFGRCC